MEVQELSDLSSAGGSLASVTYPSGRALTYSFDATGRVSSLQGVQNSNTTSYAGPITYWGNGGFNQLTLAGGALSQSFTPDYRFRPVTVAANAGSASLLNLGYTYFLNGNVKTVTFTNPGLATALTQTFGYDKTNRLSSAMETAGGSQTWVQNFCKAFCRLSRKKRRTKSYDRNMAQVHMTEADLALNLHGVLEQVRQRGEVVASPSSSVTRRHALRLPISIFIEWKGKPR